MTVNSSGNPATQRNSTAAVELLRILANERRLMIVGELVKRREVNVSALARTVGLSQSALSQHLAKMRAAGVVTCRRDGATVRYSLANPQITELLITLQSLFASLLADRDTSVG
ncbi:ArsR/SmtB family transcription factor [Aurantimonas marina]|uniref:ArsR/SmtB family transcription factor n=1 Tax=Aurantimonas marina TaxID=2780508 RepID=UPI0019CF7AA2|nr:metalloregulator ArsR/SmtB family transcription factor [Aurantimonas marina]